MSALQRAGIRCIFLWCKSDQVTLRVLRFIINPIAVRPCGGPIDPHTVEHCHLLKVREGKVGERKEAWGGAERPGVLSRALKMTRMSKVVEVGRRIARCEPAKRCKLFLWPIFFFVRHPASSSLLWCNAVMARHIQRSKQRQRQFFSTLISLLPFMHPFLLTNCPHCWQWWKC